ncbi:MAG: hypothetical protein ABI583_01910 [Betaproteobacteria bacterium]
MQNHIGSFFISKKTRANVVAVLLAIAICQGSVFGQTPRLRLGTPQVLSPLGSPLQVRVPIDVSGVVEPVSSSRFSLGTRPPNAAVPFIERAEITVESIGDSVELVIRTRNAIEEPAIGIVVREQLPNGVRSREFYLLLDPPSLVVVPVADRPTDVAVATSPPAAIASAPLQTGAERPIAPNMDTKKGLRARRSPPATSAPSNSGNGAARPITEQLDFKAPAYIKGGPRLRLSGEGDLSSMPATTEAEREKLRARLFTLEMDDLTSVLLERENRILQLEKELASLGARISITERVISGSTKPADVQKAANPVATNTLVVPELITPKPVVATNLTAADDKLVSASPTSKSWIIWLSIISAFALTVILIWRIRFKSSARAESFRDGDNHADSIVSDASLRNVAITATESKVTPAVITVPPAKSQPVQKMESTATSAGVASKVFLPPEIHFELPELSPAPTEEIPISKSADLPQPTPGPNASELPKDSPPMQKMRELQSHYTDISRLQPRVELPQRLLQQAVTVFEQGESEFAKRLLAFAAYSSPYTEEYWLALLELLYREKLSRDYSFNANLFHEIHEKSIHWDEVARIGYLLNPTDALFSIASTWSHDPPVLGSWLPTISDDSLPPATTGSFEFSK